jgi:cobalamin-dependent methionine synthase I
VLELSREAFAIVHSGDGLNAPDSVVATLFPRAEILALFAVTVGEETGLAIARSFQAHDYPVATLLDTLASEAADRAAERLESLMEMTWKREGRLGEGGAALRYSPGYCGWHVTGQRALFRHLDPKPIGITLTDACLMDPVKSVSGVILAGPRSLHRFSPTRSFCAHCGTRSCRERMRAILREPSK